MVAKKIVQNKHDKQIECLFNLLEENCLLEQNYMVEKKVLETHMRIAAKMLQQTYGYGKDDLEQIFGNTINNIW